MRAAGVLLTVVLVGCSPRMPVHPAGPPIVLGLPVEELATTAAKPPAPLNAYAPAKVMQDTVQLQARASRYVTRPDSQPAAIDKLGALSTEARNAVATMRGHHTRAGYRPADIIAARTAADLLSQYLGQVSPTH